MHNESVEFEKHLPTPEQEARPERDFSAEILAYAEDLLVSQLNKIGEGQTAEVHHVDINEKHCFKIICRQKHYSTVKVSRSGQPLQKYHPLPVEARFLADLQGLDRDVRVPRPYYSVVRKTTDEDEHTFDEGELSVLAMERLDAVSIREIIEGELPLPGNFEIESFFDKLRNFVERMHNERRIHHRDLHWGNVMVGEGGEPFVIDFGCAAHGNDEEIYAESSGGTLTRFTKDIDNVDRTERKLRQYLQASLTKPQ